MLEELVAEILERIGHSWKTDNGYIAPDYEDVRRVLDKAAAALYNEGVGTRFETGGIIVEKTNSGFDVFVYVGPYS